ncbi:AAA family ATPase [Dyadobacter bucti]|uniref:AAA family ATPase n=1 Tax=Dyadobacter bucti TaxID=2572203 RepID=UPI003F720FCB
MRAIVNPAIEAKAEATKLQVQKLLSTGQAIPGDLLYDLEIENLPMLAAPIFPKVGLVGFVGSSDTGKSAFLRQFAIAISKGSTHFLGAALTPTHGRAIYVTTEDDHIATSHLLRKQSGGDRDSLKNIRFIFDSEDLTEYLDIELEESPADCVIIDAYSDVLRGDMNQANNVRAFLNRYAELAVKHECLFIFLHHTGKGKQNYAPSKDNVLGSQGFEAKMRLVIEFRTDPKDKELRHLCIVKGNYTKADDKAKSYILRFDNNLTFHFTGKRADFEDLNATAEERGLINNSEVIKVVMQYQEEGMTMRKISEELSRKKGIKLGKSSIGKIIKEKIGPPKPDLADGNPHVEMLIHDSQNIADLGYLHKFINM